MLPDLTPAIGTLFSDLVGDPSGPMPYGMVFGEAFGTDPYAGRDPLLRPMLGSREAAPPAENVHFSGLAYCGSVVATDVFPKCIIDVAGLRWPPDLVDRLVPVLLNHDVGSGKCGWLNRIAVAQGRLVIFGEICPSEFAAARTVLAGRGRVWQLSIRIDAAYKDTEYSTTNFLDANGARVPRGIPIVRRSELREVSFVRAGADPKTAVLWRT
jgi:hypothetical protein